MVRFRIRATRASTVRCIFLCLKSLRPQKGREHIARQFQGDAHQQCRPVPPPPCKPRTWGCLMYTPARYVSTTMAARMPLDGSQGDLLVGVDLPPGDGGAAAAAASAAAVDGVSAAAVASGLPVFAISLCSVKSCVEYRFARPPSSGMMRC